MYLPETGSTSADLVTRLQGGSFVPEGHWLVADRQTAGKGRRGKTWLDGAGNFMGSTVVRLRHGDPEPATLALVTGLAVRETVLPRLRGGAQVRLKWPNDLLIDGAKLAGILLQRVEDCVVVGIGVNLAAAPVLADRKTASLGDRDRNAFAADLAQQFDVELDRWRSFGLAPMIGRWLSAAHPVGTPLSVGEDGDVFEGTFAGLTADGALQLRLAEGTTRVIHAGEVRLISDEA